MSTPLREPTLTVLYYFGAHAAQPGCNDQPLHVGRQRQHLCDARVSHKLISLSSLTYIKLHAAMEVDE